jgi:hypothetical protein
MSYQDEEGRRRSARKSNLPPPQQRPPSPQIDLLIDNNQMLRNQSTTPLSTDEQNNIFDQLQADDLLSFTSADADKEDNDIGSSDNLLSSASSSPYTHYNWPHYQPNHNITQMATWVQDQTPPTQPTVNDDTIAELQKTIQLLTSRLGRLESSKSSPPSTPKTPMITIK